jgi:hypothetical protein
MSADDNDTFVYVRNNNQAILDILDFFVTKIYITRIIVLIFKSFSAAHFLRTRYHRQNSPSKLRIIILLYKFLSSFFYVKLKIFVFGLFVVSLHLKKDTQNEKVNTYINNVCALGCGDGSGAAQD